MANIPVLVYHSMRIHGMEYQDNDLVALASDLELIADLDMEVVPLREALRQVRDGPSRQGRKLVALTCDDGGDFDFHDLNHPVAGPQRSVISILRGYKRRHAGRNAHITSFVIVSPEARLELDKTCMVGRGWWNDSWWKPAVESGLMDIANHGWDHNHDALPARFHDGVRRGTFKSICTEALADRQIRVAANYLAQKAPNPGARLFAYPYGESNDYLVNEYFERFGAEIGIDAAFGDEPTYLSPSSNNWNLPRFICGRDWRTSSRLVEILEGACRRGA